MNNEQINIAVARWCGTCVYASVPDYCRDLNAMHEAERFLHDYVGLNEDEDIWSSYLAWLGYCGENNTSEIFQCVHATARQRAEAFLRTIGKWEEGK